VGYPDFNKVQPDCNNNHSADSGRAAYWMSKIFLFFKIFNSRLHFFFGIINRDGGIKFKLYIIDLADGIAPDIVLRMFAAVNHPNYIIHGYRFIAKFPINPFIKLFCSINQILIPFNLKQTNMKKITFLIMAAVSLFLISCNSGSGGMSAKAKKNKEVNDAIMKAFEAGDFSKMGDYIAVDAIDHGGEKGDIKGLDSIVSQMKAYKEMMPDSKTTLVKEMADDEYVFYWAKVSGTMGGKPMNMTSVDVTKFKDGKAVEHWVFMDPLEMMAMMQDQTMGGGDPKAPADSSTVQPQPKME
jgi:predicted SnoaL-like aldol condensation-catalyzing enzyme